MTRSANELEMLILKACRGVGVPLGQGQDVARAVTLGCTADLLVDLIACLDTPLGAAMDLRDGATLATDVHALRDIPALADAVCHGAGAITLHNFKKTPLADCVAAHLGAALIERGADVSIAPAPARAGNPVASGPERVVVGEDHWRALEQLAARILVPETEATRLSGAGAGLTDND